MKLILIPPYQNPIVKVKNIFPELIANLEQKGHLKGVEVDFDEGYLLESPSERRDEEVISMASVGVIKKTREYSEMGKYDAIVLTGGCEPGFPGARMVSQIPVVGAVHSSVHFASLIGDRFSIIHTVPPTSLIVKHCVERYGLAHKLASVRFIGRPSTYAYGFFMKYNNKEERVKDPEVKQLINDITTQGIAAIEKDRADTLILGVEVLQPFGDEVRQSLDKAGYSEIPLILELPASVEMAKAMVNMKLFQTARAYPSADLKAIPEYW